jgi:nucleoid DNA-binding protein
VAKSLNRSGFLKEVADRAGAHKRDVEHVWENALAVIRDNVKKGTAVSITGFGKFGQRVRKARPAGMARNPFTGEMVKVAARPKSAVPRFAPAKPFKEYVGGAMKAWPKSNTKPMALGAPAAPKKAAAKKTAAKKKSAPKKKAAAKKKTAPKKKAARRR